MHSKQESRCTTQGSATTTKDGVGQVTDYSWMGLDKWDDEAIQDKIRDKSVAMRSEYIRGVTSDAMLEQVCLLTEANGEAWMTEERQNGIVGAYLARADALELLHIRLGHMPYQRIERMIRRQDHQRVQAGLQDFEGAAEGEM